MNDPKLTKPAAQTIAKPALAARPSLISAAEGKVARRTGALFKALSSDFLLREQFVTDPSQVLGEFVLGERPSDEAGDVANQLVYAVMSNRVCATGWVPTRVNRTAPRRRATNSRIRSRKRSPGMATMSPCSH